MDGLPRSLSFFFRSDPAQSMGIGMTVAASPARRLGRVESYTHGTLNQLPLDSRGLPTPPGAHVRKKTNALPLLYNGAAPTILKG